MTESHSNSLWTPENTERLKRLVLGNISAQKSVLEACRQFEFETKGQHKTYQNFLRWWFVVRPSSRDDYKAALRARRYPISTVDESSQQPAIEQHTYAEDEFQEVSTMAQQPNLNVDDEISGRLYNVLAEMLESRRQLKQSNQEFRKNLDLAERKITEISSDNKLLELELEKKDNDLEKQQRMNVENQYKYDELQEAYEQAQLRHENEYSRFQQELKELQQNYERLTREYNNYRKESTKEIETLQSSLRNAEMRNAHLTAQYEEVRKENVALSRRITDFAHQISSFVGVNAMPSVQPVPIRPAISPDHDENERAKA